ncbi:MAG TPA: sec-independent translocase [Streptosporangiaceae bacterium]|nr:sec-independent translocase [Streptosporangiaceae bacterium]
MFDLSITKILVLGLLGLVIFGPEQLPRMAAQAGRALRDLRRLADSARADLTDSLGPEFRDFDFNDLNPRAFVRKHLLEDPDDDSSPWSGDGAEAPYAELPEPDPVPATLAAGEIPPYDSEAT